MFTQSSAIETSKKFLEVLKINNVFVSNAYLFGSFANNTFSSESDIDLALFSSEFVGHSWYDTEYTFEAIKQFPNVSIITFNSFDLFENSFVKEEIIAKGIEIRINE